jgi:hypothetical protein
MESKEVFVKLVKNNYHTFSSLPGSNHIASRSSQLNLLELLHIFKPNMVLDWGSGIGTLVPLYCHVNARLIIAVEKNEWCRSQFISNIKTADNITLNEELPSNFNFDFVVIDDEISLKSILSLISQESFPKVIFVEGWRNRTVAKLSFIIFVHGLSANFTRGKDRSQEFELAEKEKSGAHFALSKENPVHSLISWLKRCSRTHEFREFRNFLMQNLGLFRLLRLLNFKARFRGILRLKPKIRVQYWRRED